MTEDEKIKQYILGIAAKLAERKAQVEIVGIKKGEGLIKRRIFNDGKDANDTTIGQYRASARGSYFTQQQFVKTGAFKPTGRNAKQRRTKSGRFVSVKQKYKKVKANGINTSKNAKVNKIRSSMFLEGGYKQLRQIQGLQTSYIDLEYFGSLIGSIQQNLKNKSPELGIYSPEEVRIANAIEERLGKTIFSPTSNEKTLVLNAMRDEINVVLKQIPR